MYISKKELLLVILLCVLFTLLNACNSSNDTNKVVIAKNGLPSVNSLISKPELHELLKKKTTTNENATLLISALTGYNEKTIRATIDIINDNNDVDFSKFGQNTKTISMEVSDESYSSVVTATAASILINNHPIIEAGDTKKGCIIKAKIETTLYSSGGTITLWIEPKNNKIIVYGRSEINQIYDLFGINDKGLLNVMDGINKSLGRYQSHEESYKK